MILSPEYHVRIAPHRKPCQQFTYGYVRKSYIHCSLNWVDDKAFLRAPSLLIVQTQWSSASGPSLQSHTRTRHAAPRVRPLPRPGGKEMRRWDSKGGAQTRMGGFSCAPRCPASLTFRDSPALLRQEGDD